ncbi:hypothetical protein VTK73DRAFT_5384 [Phialemonium thermophilum]|uniref:Uncharacterized protein n=1 Tax=Phialemonium thermophilum TaxID=223376 RepID=A0ABR3XYI0_9PEZI
MAGPTMRHRSRSTPGSFNALLGARSAAVAAVRLLSAGLSTASAAPLGISMKGHPHDSSEGDRVVLFVVSVVLVLLGGAFAGLTIALMGQDGIYLQVVSRDPQEPQQKNAKRVFDLLMKGKHWVLVTLLLSNVVVNETLPVVLDRCLGGGVSAVVGSTILIVIFGEILPQSVCVRYGLQIGGYMSKPVLALMYILAPVAWPTAKLLDKLLGEDHGTVYKKSGLKTLVTLHKSLGEVSDRLNQDEVTIISAVLDLKEKPVSTVMTPMEDVFVMSEDTVLDEKTMDMILSAGYSRIPIHEPGQPTNFVGMLLVKILITYDPEDCKRVRDFPLATLPETRPETSCLDIVNFFQEGKSHMVLVSEYPGEDHGALGVVTLEDVIEELIGEEIIDESDVFIDVHKAIRRLTPAPRARVPNPYSPSLNGRLNVETPESVAEDASEGARAIQRQNSTGGKSEAQSLSSSLRATTIMLRRPSGSGENQQPNPARPVRANIEEMRQHLRHLGPSNPATNPKFTRSTAVKIKPGTAAAAHQHRSKSVPEGGPGAPAQAEDSETTGLLSNRPKDDNTVSNPSGGYGSVTLAKSPTIQEGAIGPYITVDDADHTTHAKGEYARLKSTGDSSPEGTSTPSGRSVKSEHSQKSIGSSTGHLTPRKLNVRSGSITENIIESRGVRKVILQTLDASNGHGTTSQEPATGHNSNSAVETALEPQDDASDLGSEGEDEAKAQSLTGAVDTGSSVAPEAKATGKKKSKKKKRKGGK